MATRAELVAAGLSRRRLTTLLRTGRWQPILPAVVVAHSGPLSPRQRWRAALAYGGPDAVLSHHSAGVLHDLRVRDTCVHITVPHGRHLRSRGFVVVHQSARMSVDRVGRLPCTAAARTVVDIALATQGRRDVVALVSDAVQRRIVTVPQLIEVSGGASRRGSRWLRDALEDVVAGTRSAGESLFRSLLRQAGIAEPEWNARLDTPAGCVYIDAVWRQARLAVEIDGARWHLDAASWEADLARANRIQALGWRMLRLSVRQVMREPDRVIAALRSA